MQATHATQAGSAPLEDHLRNLILTHSDSGAVPHMEPSHATISTSTMPSEDISRVRELGDDQAQPNTTSAAPKTGRKRLNQAQRRQMNAELSIPIDTRDSNHPSSNQYMRPQNYNNPQSHQKGQQQNQFQSHTSAYQGNFQDRAVLKGGHSYGQPRRGHTQPSIPSSNHHSDWRRQQPPGDGLPRGVGVISADAFASRGSRHPSQPQPALYNPGGYLPTGFSPEQLAFQSAYLDQLCFQIVAGAEIGPDEIAEKENVRIHVEAICREVVTRYEYEVNGAQEFHPGTVELKCFGSLASGFATKAADMDLGLLSPMSRLLPDFPESPIPRLIEDALLNAGFGARLLTKTRVPIIKLCEKPDVILRQSLLDARQRWEKGLDEEEHHADEDVRDDPDIVLETSSPIDTDSKQAPTTLHMSQPSSGVKAASTPEEGLFSLKQSWNQSLTSYYGNAKRLLRRLNGRDVTHSNWQDFTEAKLILLDKVARAFISGLHDSDLRSRILQYPSFNIGDTAGLKNYRSLSGVNTMVEGERLVLSWEMRQSSSDSPMTEQAFGSTVQQWKDLQYNKKFGMDPVWFNKELQLAVDALRQIPSVQIMLLQQDQYETAIQYHGRANKIAVALSTSPTSPAADISSPLTDKSSQIIQHYVDGIRDGEIRNKVRELVVLTGTQALRTVARMHKSLHLAADYERATGKGLYRPEDLPVLEKYISILRRKPVHSTTKQPTDFEYLVPVMENETGVLDSIRQLPDPATLGPNKPRDRYGDSLEFPKSGVGVQCDVNFSAHLALQNTLLLRCYSYTDSRVRPLVLFVKHWAKARGINTPYRGTLSSYGYVLMVLHYLVNVVEPFVCPNLQQLAPPDPDLPPEALEGFTTCQGHNVRFWRDEQAIRSLAQQGQLNQNRDSLGTLLRGFFEYYAQSNLMVTVPKRGFDWGRDVISLRTHGGLLSKAEKGWTGAKTVMQLQTGAPPASAELDLTTSQSPSLNSNKAPLAQARQPVSHDGAVQSVIEQTAKPKEVKEIRHRFLFAIEDPFELEHNVARTVTHNGIVAIRDEFRRAWRIIKAAGKGHVTEDLLGDVKVHREALERRQFMSLLDEIHGNEVFTD